MSWNESGDRDGKKKDPWNKQNEPLPPNLDELIGQLRNKWRNLFGGSAVSPQRSNKKWSLFIIVLLVGIYLVSGIYVVAPAEEAVIQRFGRYVRSTEPGPHWMAPLIETKQVVNVKEVGTEKYGGQMLTKDENIVSAEIAVQYRIYDPRQYLFNLVDLKSTLEQVSESAVRAVVGQSTLNEVLTSGRSEIGLEVRKQIQQYLSNYQAGIEISDLAMQQTKAPEEVKAAFDDAIKAQQDEERLVNEAEAYSRKILPLAEGRAKRTLEEAGAYREKVVLEAQGKTAKFAKILPEYQKAPQVTRERLYLDALQSIYAKTPKIVIDVAQGNNLIYLPLDKLQLPARSYAEFPAKEEKLAIPNQRAIPISRSIDSRPSYDEVER